MLLLSGILIISLFPQGLAGQKFYPDDPIAEDADNLDIPPVEEVWISDYYDFMENSFLKVGQEENPVPAGDVNTLGEVPDSSWYTNRHAVKRMTIEELKRGPNMSRGPDMDHPWAVIRGKSSGITPGFVIRDARGDMYFIKFDPMTNPEMSTSAEMIASKFFYAAGYNVPENYIVHILPEMMQIGAGAVYTDFFGEKKKLTKAFIDDVLKKVPHRSDGTIRIVASKAIPGIPAGPFKYYGTRSDDPNDIFPHQDRRVLRGLYVLASWLNHDDSRSINTLDTYVKENETHYIKHYLMDFGSCFGSGSVKSQSLRAGWSYLFEPGDLFKGMGSFGLWTPKYLKPEYKEIPSIGRFECALFEPDTWKPEYPNPAFRNMRLSDAYWGAKLVMSFSEKEIAAICSAGEFSDEEAELYLYQCLVHRMYKIIGYWFSRLLPLDHFEILDNTLHFENLAVEHDLTWTPTTYRYAWSLFDNATLETTSLDLTGETVDTTIPIPDQCFHSDQPAFFVVTLQGENTVFPDWKKRVDVYLRADAENIEVVGIDREE